MPTCLALFRGINIGGHHKLPIKELVSLLEEEGCSNIKTYLQSGNVIFDTRRQNRRKLSDDIRRSISTRYGFSPTVILLTPAELQSAIADNPFPTDDGKAVSFLFMESQPETPDLERLNALRGESETFLLADRVFYLYTPDGVGRSQLAAKAERCLGVATTGRNWNTVRRLAAMLDTFS
jgi:uncharacterized protein (DUF1697 family)